MAMLYLTPVLPLGLVSYACGTTTMDISAFALAKIASLPLYLLYTFMGASAHSFIKRGAQGGRNISHSVTAEAKKLEENQLILMAGLVLSVVMMALITRHIRRELMKVSSHSAIRIRVVGLILNLIVYGLCIVLMLFFRFLISKRRKPKVIYLYLALKRMATMATMWKKRTLSLD
jgi:hypothetical protein